MSSKGLMKYKRVAQRMREKFDENEFTKKDLEDAIFIEVGVDPRTVRATIERMIRLELMIKVDNQPREFGVMPKEKYKLTRAKEEYW